MKVWGRFHADFLADGYIKSFAIRKEGNIFYLTYSNQCGTGYHKCPFSLFSILCEELKLYFFSQTNKFASLSKCQLFLYNRCEKSNSVIPHLFFMNHHYIALLSIIFRIIELSTLCSNLRERCGIICLLLFRLWNCMPKNGFVQFIFLSCCFSFLIGNFK